MQGEIEKFWVVFSKKGLFQRYSGKGLHQVRKLAPTFSNSLIAFWMALLTCSSVNVAFALRRTTLIATLFLPWAICSPR